jgi:3'(2'), 5'-bisphosphate nucleotidase
MAFVMSPQALADALLPAVFAAARIQMRYFRSGAKVETKSDATPVTVADQESEAVLLQALARIAPHTPVVAEEAMASGRMPDVGGGAMDFFLVDPLDGTREFIADRPEFTINIALIRNRRPTFGLIYAPAQGLLFATLGERHAVEAHVQPDRDASRMSDITTREIRSRAAPAEGMIAVASRSHGSPGTDAFLGQYKIQRRTAAGSSLKFCVVAKGEADIYPRVGRTCEWDTAAGQAILQSAGGSVTRLDGEPMLYGNSADRFRNPDYVAWCRGPVPPQH